MKPSSLNLQQSSSLNGSPSFTMMAPGHHVAQATFQMPKVSDSPTVYAHSDSYMHKNEKALNGFPSWDYWDHHHSKPHSGYPSQSFRNNMTRGGITQQRRTLPKPPTNIH